MKIKWTTITEDKSTWPAIEGRVLINTKENDAVYIVEMKKYVHGTCLARMNADPGREYVTDSRIMIPILNYYGRQWRPIPKPPKKKKESPWKSIKDCPPPASPYKIMVRYPYRDSFIYDCCHRRQIGEICTEWMEIPE